VCLFLSGSLGGQTGLHQSHLVEPQGFCQKYAMPSNICEDEEEVVMVEEEAGVTCVICVLIFAVCYNFLTNFFSFF
jgi:hypothetical protein